MLTSGMKLPNADKAVVEREKIVDYLLNADHRYGASKARFFSKFGFHAAKWERLAQALRRHGQSHEVKRAKETGFGPRYEVEGELNAADGRSPRVRSVWQLDHGEVAPRLITAYPLENR
ncbi:MAG TPA: hypothetical protein VK731_09955 [Candidatus Cybelea sp.]|jgi:hypothetical protein|nr:hypothetical protein [Candidatus Cybelea sp.]